MSETPLDVQIVPMATNHLAAVLKIEKTVFRDSWTAASFLEVISLSDKSWVALHDGEVVGYLVTQWVLDEVHILNLAVVVSMQRQGIAAQLMRFLLDLCCRHGMRDLFLEVRISNQPAIHLYQRFGFRELTLRKSYYPDGEDAWVMHSRLEIEDDLTSEAGEMNERGREG